MRAVLNKLPKQVHRQSMTMASLTTAGTPDVYLDLDLDLWVEFKWNAGLPRALDAGRMLSDLQKQWLGRRYAAGGNACVVVGFPWQNRNCGVVLTNPTQWLNAIQKPEYYPLIMAIPEVADYLLSRVSTHGNYSNNRVHAPQSRRPSTGAGKSP